MEGPIRWFKGARTKRAKVVPMDIIVLPWQKRINLNSYNINLLKLLQEHFTLQAKFRAWMGINRN